jgi:hypothetical protein
MKIALRVLAGASVVAASGVVYGSVGCQTKPRAIANQIRNRADIPGGPRSLGDIGDFVLHNGVIRAVVQNVGYSKGFGVFGGSLIDMDLERAAVPSTSTGTTGFDGFSEMFPAFFLEAVEPTSVTVKNDGSDGNAAVVEVKGGGAEFLTETKVVDQVVLNTAGNGPLNFTVDYSLAPGAKYLNVQVTASNPTQCIRSLCQVGCSTNTDCPSGRSCQQGACTPVPCATSTDCASGQSCQQGSCTQSLCGTSADCAPYAFPSNGLPLPTGFIALVGDGQRLFVPGIAGYDTRYTLQDDIWPLQWQLPAIGGVVTPLWITEGNAVSYGMMPVVRNNYVLQSLDQYASQMTPLGNPPESVFIPLVSGSFMGAFVTTPPTTLPAGKSFSYAVNMLLGNGDASSVYDTYYQARADMGKPITTGRVGGLVLEQTTFKPQVGAWVVLKSAAGYVSSAMVMDNGQWTAQVPPGTYEATAVSPPRDPVRQENVVVSAGQQTGVNLLVEQLGQIVVTTVDQNGQWIPSKVSVEGTLFGGVANCQDPKSYLFDLKLGQPWRQSEMATDNTGCPPGAFKYTGRYLEGQVMSATGQVSVPVRPCQAPCSYKIYVSRGPSYDMFTQGGVGIDAGQIIKIGAVLHRVVDDSQYVTGDFHVHSVNSIDSSMDLVSRVTSYAAEGVDFLSSTDHNFITDLSPTVAQLNLQQFVKTTVGLELTTLELGHFNAWPLKFQTGPITHGSFQWFEIPTQDYHDSNGNPEPGLFSLLRRSGSTNQTVVEVNHPRDSILGYFTAFSLDQNGNPITRTDVIRPNGPAFVPSAFSYGFDAMEVLNGKRFDQRRNAVAPNPVPPPPLGQSYPSWLQGIKPGQVVTDSNGNVAFPGIVDDWFHFLTAGRVFTAMGNSDSHNAYAEAGTPRNFLYVGQRPKSMYTLSEQTVDQAILNHQVIVSDGPLVELCAGTACGAPGTPWPSPGPGAALVGGNSYAPSGQVTVRVRVQAAPWVDVSDVKIWRGETIVQEFAVPPSQAVIRTDQSFTISIPQNTYVIAEISGSKTMWPAVTAYEQPPILISDAVRSIAEQFPGFVTNYFSLDPSLVQEVVPWAITNPIWVNLTGSTSSPLTVSGPPPLVMNPPGPLPHRTADLWHVIAALHGE